MQLLSLLVRLAAGRQHNCRNFFWKLAGLKVIILTICSHTAEVFEKQDAREQDI